MTMPCREKRPDPVTTLRRLTALHPDEVRELAPIISILRTLDESHGPDLDKLVDLLRKFHSIGIAAQARLLQAYDDTVESPPV
jgi:hypothetical protein